MWDAVSNEFAVVDEARSQQDFAQVKDVAALFGQDLASFGELKVIPFKESYKISTYLYAICAGSYAYHENHVEGLPPMRIYARKSLIGDLNFDEMFKVTGAGIKFYSVFFGQTYPFNKYD